MIDFFADARAFIEGTGDDTTINYTETTPKDFKAEELAEQKELCFYDGLEIAEDGSFITIDGETFKVPEWYSKAMIKNRDKKTIDMVFIHYGYDYSRLNNSYRR